MPSVVAPSRKVTFPDGAPAPGEITPTEAVKVTASPGPLGLRDEVSIVVVAALSTVWTSGFVVDEEAKFVSPW